MCVCCVLCVVCCVLCFAKDDSASETPSPLRASRRTQEASGRGVPPFLPPPIFPPPHLDAVEPTLTSDDCRFFSNTSGKQTIFLRMVDGERQKKRGGDGNGTEVVVSQCHNTSVVSTETIHEEKGRGGRGGGGGRKGGGDWGSTARRVGRMGRTIHTLNEGAGAILLQAAGLFVVVLFQKTPAP